MKYYAIRNGKKTGIFTNWDEVKELVANYPNAQYKSFKNEKDAKAYLEGVDVYKAEIVTDTDIVAYIDGSYNPKNNTCGAGGVILQNDNVIYEFTKKIANEELVDQRNVVGELSASMYAMQFALKNGFKSITIVYDYEGVEKWCNSEWKAKNDTTKAYKEFYEKMSAKLNIKFIKVSAHKGNKYNEEADKLAKKACS